MADRRAETRRAGAAMGTFFELDGEDGAERGSVLPGY